MMAVSSEMVKPRCYGGDPRKLRLSSLAGERTATVRSVQQAGEPRVPAEMIRSILLGRRRILAPGLHAAGPHVKAHGRHRSRPGRSERSEGHTPELKSLMRSSYAVSC